MARPEKIATVKAIAGELEASQCVVLMNYHGLTVEQMTNFRNICREKNVGVRVVKNRLAMIAADQSDMSGLKEHLTGPLAMILGNESQVDPAKIVVDFAKDNEALELVGGFMDGEHLSVENVVALSKIPSRDELYAKMMGSINSPLTGIVGVTNGVIAALTRAIDAVAKQKEAA
jgi:large subunit ribosomal protein L10